MDLAGDARAYAAMIMFAQFAQRARRGDDDQRLEIIRERTALQDVRRLYGEAILLLLMEIDLVHGVAPAAGA